MSIPQQVTKHYISNLILKGRNDAFEIDRIEQHVQVIEGDPLGFHFEAVVKDSNDFGMQKGYAATPRQAVGRALKKFGVEVI